MSIRYDYVYINGRKVAKHVAVWEAANGPKPPNHDIHHIDGNGKNNALSNLVCLSKSEHQRLHQELRKEGKDIIDPTDPVVMYERERARAERKAAYAANPERFHERDRKYRAENKELIRERQKKYYIENHDKIRESQRQYELRHKSERSERNAKYYQEHSEQRKQYRKQYDIEHREDVSAHRKQYRLEHLEEIKAKAAAFREKNRPYLAAKQRVYMARKRGLPEDVIEKLKIEAEQIREQCNRKEQQ